MSSKKGKGKGSQKQANHKVKASDFRKASQKQGRAGSGTKRRAGSTFNNVERWCKMVGINGVGPHNLKPDVLRRYAEYQLERGNYFTGGGKATSTVRTELSAIRKACAGAGNPHALPTNKELGLSTGEKRLAKGVPISDERLEKEIQTAAPDIKQMMICMRELGLRMSESIHLHHSIERVIGQFERGNSFFYIQEGAKGGRGRDVFIDDTQRERQLTLLKETKEHIQNNGGWMVKGAERGKKTGPLESARNSSKTIILIMRGFYELGSLRLQDAARVAPASQGGVECRRANCAF